MKVQMNAGSAVEEAAAPEAAPEAAAGQAPEAAQDAAQAGSTPSPENSGTQPAASASPAAAEPKFALKVDGKVIEVSRDEAIALAQKGHSFTQKTQQLADEKRRWETDRQTLLDQEKQRWQREQQEWQRQQEQARLAAEDPARHALNVAQQAQAKTEDMALDFAIKSALSKYPDVNERELLIEAQMRGITRPDQFNVLDAVASDLAKASSERFESRFAEIIGKGEHPLLKKMNDDALAKYLKDKEIKPAPLGGSAGGSTPPPMSSGPKRAKSLDEAQDIANEMMGVVSRA